MTGLSITRRAAVFGVLSASATSRGSAQEVFPARPIRVIVPFGAGGLADVTTRIAGEAMARDLGQPVVVVNQPGANGVTAAKSVLSSPTDGYTLALLTNGTAVAAATMRNPGFDAEKDFAPIALLGTFDFVFLVAGKGRFGSLSDILEDARRSPGKLTIGTVSAGSSQHLSAVLFKSLAGIDATILPFRTSPDVLTALIRDDVQLAIDGYAAAAALLGDGQLRAVATSGLARSPVLDDVPTVHEAGVAGFEVTSWNGLFAPVGTPRAAIDRLTTSVAAALSQTAVRQRLLELGITPACGADRSCGGLPQEAGRRLAADIKKWRMVAEKAGISTP